MTRKSNKSENDAGKFSSDIGEGTYMGKNIRKAQTGFEGFPKNYDSQFNPPNTPDDFDDRRVCAVCGEGERHENDSALYEDDWSNPHHEPDKLDLLEFPIPVIRNRQYDGKTFTTGLVCGKCRENLVQDYADDEGNYPPKLEAENDNAFSADGPLPDDSFDTVASSDNTSFTTSAKRGKLMKRASFSNGTQVIFENGKLRRVAQQYTSQDTMPKEMLEDGDVRGSSETFEVPRDESVGIKQTNPTEVVVYEYPYSLGDNGCDTDIVPRDSSGDGLGGPKVTFEEEKADGYNQGNPDDYVQTLQPRIKPTPRGDKKNHAVASSNDLLKRIAELEQALADTEEELENVRIASQRESIARRIAQAEKDKGIYAFKSEEEFETRVASITEQTSVSSLLRELDRVRNLPVVNASMEAQANATGFTASAARKTQGFEVGAGYSLQTGLTRFASRNGDNPTAALTRGGSLTQLLQDNMYLGKMFPAKQEESKC